MMEKERFHSWFALFATIGLASYQLILCFINTHGFPVNNNIVAATEGSILGLVALVTLPRKNLAALAIPAIILAYFILMFVLREETDPQGLRNLFVIYAMFSLGQQTTSLRDLNVIVWTLSFIAAVFALFEYFYIDLYLDTFNILQYYAARGMVTEEQLSYLNTNLWVSGLRPDGRTILPFLGDQRVSSIFLEPVSMGNYAAIVAMWALSFDLRDWRKSIGHYLAAAFFIVACDSRFASIVVLVMFGIRFFPFTQKPWALYLIPVVVVLGLSYYASLNLVDPTYDDLPGRLAKTGVALLNMTLPEVFGAGDPSGPVALYDMGIPYSLVVFGVVLCFFLWAMLVFMKFETAQGQRMRAMLAIYCMGLLMISGTSFFASKTACLLWLIVGALRVQHVHVATAAAGLPHPEEPFPEMPLQDISVQDEAASAPAAQSATGQ